MKKTTLISLLVTFVLFLLLAACTSPVQTRTVRFLVDETVYESLTVEQGESVTFPKDPEKTGQAFTGWLDEQGSPCTSLTNVTEDRTLVASFALLSYTITYDLAGGVNPEDAVTTYSLSTTALALPRAVKAGHAFKGWLLEGELVTEIPAGTIGDVKLVACFTGESHVFQLDAAGGTVSPATVSVVNGTDYSLPVPTRTGYDFSGWTLDGEMVTSATVFLADGTLVANWTITTYEIMYRLNGGTTEGLVTTYTIETETFTLPVPQRENYDFVGWAGTDITTATTTVTVTKGSTGWRDYQAIWQVHRATITFFTNGGTDCANLTGATGSALVLPTPSRKGYSFAGWFLDDACTIPYVATVYPHDDMALQAGWNVRTFTISFAGVERDAITYTVEQGVVVSNPVKEGYTFTGWTAEDFLTVPCVDLVITRSTLLTLLKDFTLTANWTLATTTITFDSRGGSTVESLTALSGQAISSPADPVRTGAMFGGWYQDGSYTEAFTFTTMPSASLTLYAKWEGLACYTLHYLASPGSDALSSNYRSGDKVYVGDEVWLVAREECAGEVFDRWLAGTTVIARTLSWSFTMPSSDVSLTAEYVATTMITYDRESGEDLILTGDGTLTLVSGEGLTSTDLTLSGTSAVITASFAASLALGTNAFLLSSEDSDALVWVEVVSSLAPQDVRLDYDAAFPEVMLCFTDEGKDYAYAVDGGTYVTAASGIVIADYDKSKSHLITVVDLDGGVWTTVSRAGYTTDEATYYLKSFTWNGDTWDYEFETVNEFETWLMFSVLADGLEKRTITTQKPYGTYSTKGLLGDALVAGARGMFANAFQRFSVPISTSYSYSFSDQEVSFYVTYLSSANDVVSSQVAKTVSDVQGLLTTSSRGSDFNDFAIDGCTKTEVVTTIYELENLALGVRPLIESSGVVHDTYEAARAVLRVICDDAMTDYEKITAMYDWIGLNVTYDDVAASASANYGQYRSFTSAGVFLDHVAVCDGTASAMKLMATIEGIECREVIGKSDTYGHAWNKVKIDGCWLALDATWCRRTATARLIPATATFITHDYLFMDEATLRATRHEEAGFARDPSVRDLATARHDYYHLTVVDGAKDYDLVADSLAEYKAILAWAKARGMSYVDFKATVVVSYDYYVKSADGSYVYISHVS